MGRCILGLIASFSLVLFFSCAPTTTLVQPPSIPPTPAITLDEAQFSKPMFQPPASLNFRFIETSGRNARTEDNITIRVASITDRVDDDTYTTIIEGPDGNKYTYSLFPMMLVLEITNNTNHIVRLTRTIIHIEDENQIEYPLINTFQENKKWLIDQVRKSFDEYLTQTKILVETAQTENHYIELYRKALYEGSYPEDYNRFVKELTGGGQVRTPDIEQGYHLTDYGKKSAIEDYVPDAVFRDGASKIRRHVSESSYRMRLQYSVSNERDIVALREKAVKQIDELPNVTDIITQGEYLPISVLPGRTKRIIAPITKPFVDGEFRSVIVNIFDLPTLVNQAGDPIKRANFRFEFRPERI